MNVLLLRFDAPLMSFGAPLVDNRGVIQPYPALSMMTGLIGNALGYDHAQSDRLEVLQRRLRYAVRQDRPGRRVQDYQTVDFSKPYMDDDRAWTTRGELEQRKGGSASKGTHIRQRDYWADAVYTIALKLDPPGDANAPALSDVSYALLHPERPLFVGRKTCLPADTLHPLCARADSLLHALCHAPLHKRAQSTDGTYAAWWPASPDGDGIPAGLREHVSANLRRPVTDRRDWVNQIHAGQRWITRGDLTLEPSTAGSTAV